jgi:hypothetical protein
MSARPEQLAVEQALSDICDMVKCIEDREAQLQVTAETSENGGEVMEG